MISFGFGTPQVTEKAGHLEDFPGGAKSVA
jgi:hypothetical protein